MLEQKGIACTINSFPEGSISLRGGIVSELPGYDEGLFYVQDKAARIAAQLCKASAGMKVLDACASPGGKSMAMAIDMADNGSILSCDIQQKKLRLIEENAARLGISIIKTRQMDAREYVEEFDSAFDVVMADVPCSGMGVIAKKPEIRQKTADEIASLPRIQADILENLSRYVKPGGALVYSTCTVLKAENEEIVTDFLSKHHNFHAQEIRLGETVFKDGMHTFWPHIDGTDGFFAARLIRDK